MEPELILWKTANRYTLSVIKNSRVWFIVIPNIALKAAVVPTTAGIASPDSQGFTRLYYYASQAANLIPFL